MGKHSLNRIHVLVGTLTLAAGPVFAQMGSAPEVRHSGGSPGAGVRERVAAVERLIESRTDESVQRFVDEQLAPAFRATKTREQWTATLQNIRGKYQGFGTLRLRPAGAGVALEFGKCPGEGVPLLMEVDAAAPHLITDLRLGEPKKAESASRVPAQPPLTWDNLRERLKAEEAGGFSGSVLVVRDNQVVLHEGYGLADREKHRADQPETVFAIGSTPIDFTRGAILKLEDMGKLSTDDPIAKHLPGVPEDKKAITIDHLMSGRSGLRNFHLRPEDTDSANMWIDRDTALKRILEDELLFPPGTDRAHSHSAFVMLAAIVETVSGIPYAAFLEKEMFEPAGMTRTSLYEDIAAPEEEVAIGYGGASYTSVNSPVHWGKTSWLVLGSGGMASTTGDLFRWNQALRDGKLLSKRAAEEYWSPGGGVLVGASMNGFFTAYTQGPGSMFVLCSNEIGREATEQLVMDLARLVN